MAADNESTVDLIGAVDALEEQLDQIEAVLAEMILARISDVQVDMPMHPTDPDPNPPVGSPSQQPGVTAAARKVRRAVPDDGTLGGFDDIGNWHDPGSGEFAKPGWSTAKALALEAMRSLFAVDHVKGKPDGDWLVARDNYLSRLGIGKGQAVRVRFGDDQHGIIDVFDTEGRRSEYRVKWGRFADFAADDTHARIDRPQQRGNTTATKVGVGALTATRLKEAGDQGGPAQVADGYLARYGIAKGDIVHVRYSDDRSALVTTGDGREIKAAWARFTDNVPRRDGDGWAIDPPPEAPTPDVPEATAPSPEPDVPTITKPDRPQVTLGQDWPTAAPHPVTGYREPESRVLLPSGREVEIRSVGGDSIDGDYLSSYAMYDAASGDRMGYLDYTSSSRDGELFIRMVEADPGFHGEQVGDVLLARTIADNPDLKVNPGVLTEDGAKWWERVQEWLPEKNKMPATEPGIPEPDATPSSPLGWSVAKGRTDRERVGSQPGRWIESRTDTYTLDIPEPDGTTTKIEVDATLELDRRNVGYSTSTPFRTSADWTIRNEGRGISEYGSLNPTEDPTEGPSSNTGFIRDALAAAVTDAQAKGVAEGIDVAAPEEPKPIAPIATIFTKKAPTAKTYLAKIDGGDWSTGRFSRDFVSKGVVSQRATVDIGGSGAVRGWAVRPNFQEDGFYEFQWQNIDEYGRLTKQRRMYLVKDGNVYSTLDDSLHDQVQALYDDDKAWWDPTNYDVSNLTAVNTPDASNVAPAAPVTPDASTEFNAGDSIPPWKLRELPPGATFRNTDLPNTTFRVGDSGQLEVGSGDIWSPPADGWGAISQGLRGDRWIVDSVPDTTPDVPEALEVPDRPFTTVEEARQLGAQAYRDGKTNAPALDKNLVLNPEVGSNIDVLKAWQDGWTAANLAAPVPEPDAPNPDVPETRPSTPDGLRDFPLGSTVTMPSGTTYTTESDGVRSGSGTLIPYDTFRDLVGADTTLAVTPSQPDEPVDVPNGPDPLPDTASLDYTGFDDSTAAWREPAPYSTDRYASPEIIYTLNPESSTVTVLLPDGLSVTRSYKGGSNVVVGRDRKTGIWDAKIMKGTDSQSFEWGGSAARITRNGRGSNFQSGTSERRKALAVNALLNYAAEKRDTLDPKTRKALDAQIAERLAEYGYEGVTEPVAIPDAPDIDPTGLILDPNVLASEFQAVLDVRSYNMSAADLAAGDWANRATAVARTLEARWQAGDPNVTLGQIGEARKKVGTIRYALRRTGTVESDAATAARLERFGRTTQRAADLVAEARALGLEGGWNRPALDEFNRTLETTLPDLIAIARGGDQIALDRIGSTIAYLDLLQESMGAQPRKFGSAIGAFPPLDGFTDADLMAVQNGYEVGGLGAFIDFAERVTDQLRTNRVAAQRPDVTSAILAAIPEPDQIKGNGLVTDDTAAVDKIATAVLTALAQHPDFNWSDVQIAVGHEATSDLTPPQRNLLHAGMDEAQLRKRLIDAFADGAAFPTAQSANSLDQIGSGQFKKAGLSDFWVDKFGARFGSEATADHDLAMASWAEAVASSPMLAAQVDSFGAPVFGYFSHGVDPNTIAFVVTGTSVIGFNKSRAESDASAWAAVSELLRSRTKVGDEIVEIGDPADGPIAKSMVPDGVFLDDATKRKWTFSADGSVTGLVRHEFGHVIDGKLEHTRRRERERFIKYVLDNQSVIAEVSRYAATNRAELIAEFYTTVTHPKFHRRRGYSREAEQAFSYFLDYIRPVRPVDVPIAEPSTPTTQPFTPQLPGIGGGAPDAPDAPVDVAAMGDAAAAGTVAP